MQTKRFRWTSEEDRVIRDNYSDRGLKSTYEILCKTFGKRHPYESFKSRVRDLKLHVTEARWREACKDNGYRENVPVGTIVKRSRGEHYIKVSNGTQGWIPYKVYLMGNVGSGNLIVHIDKNPSNCSIDNLEVIDRQTNARMTAYCFWNENPDITKTGILVCKLETLINKTS